MTQEDKELLLKDLSARLPYGVKCACSNNFNGEFDIISPLSTSHIDMIIGEIHPVKPYLRPMSSMTEEERTEVDNLIKENRPNPYGIINNKGIDNLLFSVSVTSGVLNDWLNAHYFDYRGLIEKGLAIAVTEENNPYK